MTSVGHATHRTGWRKTDQAAALVDGVAELVDDEAVPVEVDEPAGDTVPLGVEG